MDPAIDTTEMREEIAARLREELDYDREARHIGLYREVLAEVPEICVPPVYAELSTRRLLTMGWLAGRRLIEYKGPLDERNASPAPCSRPGGSPSAAMP